MACNKQFENLLTTILPNSYWAGTGAYQGEFELLLEQLLPSTGSAHTIKGEIVRAISRLCYEYHNNGNCNTRSYDDNDKYYLNPRVADFWKRFLEIIEETIPELKPIVQAIEDVILLKSGGKTLSNKNQQKYNNLIDGVMYHLLKKGKKEWEMNLSDTRFREIAA